jgi:site-specific DNA-cytosine methylase
MKYYLSCYSGILGLDACAEALGLTPLAFCDSKRSARRIIARHRPGVPIYESDEELLRAKFSDPIELLVGGPPCPPFSRARGDRPASVPDRSGFMLALAGRFAPRWVVRENVCSPAGSHFAAGLELLGYRAVIAELDATPHTGQSRLREFIVGCPGPGAAARLRSVLAERVNGNPGDDPAAGDPEQARVFSCLVAHPKRYNDGTDYVYEDSVGRCRVLSATERERLQGFPAGWTAGLPFFSRSNLLGNAVCRPVAWLLGECIKEAQQ